MPTSTVPEQETKGKMVCPVCGELARRIERRPMDRVVSLVKPVKRYYCIICHWTEAVPSKK